MKQLSTYYRRFTELFPKRFKHYSLAFTAIMPYLGELVIIWSFALFGVLAYVGYVMIGEYNQASVRYQQELSQLAHWERVVSERPEYPTGYFQAGIHALRLNKTQKALEYFQKALLLDPNFKQAEVFAQEIEK